MQRKEFDQIQPSRHVNVRPIRIREIPELAEFSKTHLPSLQLDDLSDIRRVVEFDNNVIQVFETDDQLVGLYAMLFLNQPGLRALIEDRFDGARPDCEFLAHRTENPAAVYTWFVACPGRAVTGFGNVAQLLHGKRFASADLYARPASPAGLRLMLGIGYRAMSTDPASLHKYTRICNRTPIHNIAA